VSPMRQSSLNARMRWKFMNCGNSVSPPHAPPTCTCTVPCVLPLRHVNVCARTQSSLEINQTHKQQTNSAKRCARVASVDILTCWDRGRVGVDLAVATHTATRVVVPRRAQLTQRVTVRVQRTRFGHVPSTNCRSGIRVFRHLYFTPQA
jgi:hypothetical protein